MSMARSPDVESLEQIIERLRSDPGRTAILTDIDGTIAPIVARPEEVTVHPKAPEILRTLRDRFAVVACISGRRAAEASQIVGVEGITYSGNHGMETLEPDTQEIRLDLALRGHADSAASFFSNLDRDWLRETELRHEDKGPIQALHWRGASDEAAAEAAARQIAEQAEHAGLEPHWGRKVLEIRPAGGGGKGAAITNLLVNAEVDTAVYTGDDRTDIDAFRRLRELHRESEALKTVYCLGIDSPEGPPGLSEHADVMLEGPDHWIEVLDRLAR